MNKIDVFKESAVEIYVGNMPFSVTEEDVRNLFAEYGEVVEVRLIMDKHTGKSKGFGFVKMADEEQVEKAIEALSGSEFMERTITVSQAKAKQDNRDRRGGFRGGRGGGPRGNSRSRSPRARGPRSGNSRDGNRRSGGGGYNRDRRPGGGNRDGNRGGNRDSGNRRY